MKLWSKFHNSWVEMALIVTSCEGLHGPCMEQGAALWVTLSSLCQNVITRHTHTVAGSTILCQMTDGGCEWLLRVLSPSFDPSRFAAIVVNLWTIFLCLCIIQCLFPGSICTVPLPGIDLRTFCSSKTMHEDYAEEYDNVTSERRLTTSTNTNNRPTRWAIIIDLSLIILISSVSFLQLFTSTQRHTLSPVYLSNRILLFYWIPKFSQLWK